MTRVLVLGAAGLLGHKLCQRLEGYDVVGTVRRDVSGYADFREVFGGVRLLGGVDALDDQRLVEAMVEARPDVVVNCIGIVKQLEQTRSRYLSAAVNAYLPHRLARICAEHGARLIHISTDCVFDGTRGSYAESDPPDALDLYGMSKSLGETDATETAAVTLRTSFIGRELTLPTHGLLEWFLSSRGGSVNGFARVIYSGVTTIEMARVIQSVIDAPRQLRGVYHVASEPLSKCELLQIIRESGGIDVEVNATDQPISDLSLVMDGFHRETGYVAPSWPDMIRALSEDPTPYSRWRAEGAEAP